MRPHLGFAVTQASAYPNGPTDVKEVIGYSNYWGGMYSMYHCQNPTRHPLTIYDFVHFSYCRLPQLYINLENLFTERFSRLRPHRLRGDFLFGSSLLSSQLAVPCAIHEAFRTADPPDSLNASRLAVPFFDTREYDSISSTCECSAGFNYAIQPLRGGCATYQSMGSCCAI
jgi:hypothetical protein